MEVHTDHSHTGIRGPDKPPAKRTAPHRFQPGTSSFVSPLTCERNQPPSPSPHYSSQPGWSNSITKNISPLWQSLCGNVSVLRVFCLRLMYSLSFFFCIYSNGLFFFNRPTRPRHSTLINNRKTSDTFRLWPFNGHSFHTKTELLSCLIFVWTFLNDRHRIK